MSVELTEEKKQEERVKAQQYAEMMNIPYVDPFPEQQPNPDNLPPAPVELSNEELLELLNKRTGATITNLDDLKPKPTPEEISAQQEKEKTDMHVYGLTSGKFTQAEWDAYQITLANKKELVRDEITSQLKTAFPELADDAIQEKVANYLFEHLDETDPLRVAREKELTTLSDLKIKEKFKNIVNLPTDFGQYKEGVNNKVNLERRIQATLPVYTADVNRALDSLRAFTVLVPDTKDPSKNVSVELGYDDQDIKEVATIFLTNDQITKAVTEGYTVEQIKETADLVLWKKHGPRLISNAAKKYNSTQKDHYLMARKGLNPLNDNLDVSEEELKEEVHKQYDEMIASAPVK